MLPFKLQAFETQTLPDQNISVSGILSQHQQMVSLTFRVEGAHHFELPSLESAVKREMNLWEKSCFEIFIRPLNTEAYLEFNLSPNGDWNAFVFKDYRTPLMEDGALTLAPMQKDPVCATTGIPRSDAPWRLDVQIDLSHLPKEFHLPANRMIGLSCVLKDLKGGLHYFALSHPGEKPDFHHQESFQLRL